MRLIIDIEKMGNGKMRLDFESENDYSRLVDPDATRIGEEILAYINDAERYRNIYLHQLDTVKAVVDDYMKYKDDKRFYSHVASFSWIDFDFFDGDVLFNVGEIYCLISNEKTLYHTEGFSRDVYGTYNNVREKIAHMQIDDIIRNDFADAYVDNDPIKEFVYKPFVPNYVYGMRSRGFSPACQPMEGLIERRDSADKKYYDLLVYSRPLNENEIEAYQLDFLGLEEEK